MIFSTVLPVSIYDRPQGSSADWQEVQVGPCNVTLEDGREYRLRIKGIDDDVLETLVGEMKGLTPIVCLDLAENRRITDEGLRILAALPHLRFLNLSSCSLTSEGLPSLGAFIHMENLDLSYCNRITDLGLRSLRSLSALKRLNLQGCVKVTNGGVARLRRRGLEIHVK